MVPAFGFSVGDFVSAIDLTIKIGRALRETGGASTECRMVIQDLQNHQQILELLKEFKPAGGSLSHVNAIKGVALTCLVPLREFAEKIDRNYGSIATASSSSDQFFRRGGKKAKWAIFATEEVAKFRTILAAKCQEHRHFLETNLSTLAISNHRGLSKEIHEVREDLKDEVKRIGARMETRHHVLAEEASQHVNKLDELNDRISQVQKDAYSNTKVLVGLCFGTAAGAEHMFRALRRDSRKIGEEVKSIRDEQNQMGLQVAGKFQAVYDQVKMIRFIGTSILRCLLPFSEKVIQFLRENMKANMETYDLLLRTQSEMPKQLDNGDKFHFEDVLGRTKNLPYEYFRHWEVFESMLRCEFRGLPGEEKVQRGQYILLNHSSARNQIDPVWWQHMVCPGTQIKMSVFAKKIGLTTGSCPRPNCRERSVNTQDGRVYHCPICGLNTVTQMPFNSAYCYYKKDQQRSVISRGVKPLKARLEQDMVHRDEDGIDGQPSLRKPKERAEN